MFGFLITNEMLFMPLVSVFVLFVRMKCVACVSMLFMIVFMNFQSECNVS